MIGASIRKKTHLTLNDRKGKREGRGREKEKERYEREGRKRKRCMEAEKDREIYRERDKEGEREKEGKISTEKRRWRKLVSRSKNYRGKSIPWTECDEAVAFS